jgi:hypothetical protein
MPDDIADASIYIRTRDGHEIRICTGRESSNGENKLSPEEIALWNRRRIEGYCRHAAYRKVKPRMRG